jgi:anion-transporting  ArsA/GET3 family ATPase
LTEPLHRQLQYVGGKGGVGKSVVACALARAYRRKGLNVLLVQANAPDSHGPLLEIGHVGPELHEVEPGFHVVNIHPSNAMKEYALMTLKFEAVYRTVFENRLTRAFLRFVPSLQELTIQGKIWFHCEEKRGDEHRFDRVVVDCPATGHGIKLLRTAQVIRDASRVGPMAEKTRLMAELVADPARTALHVVTLPEELPVNETFDLVAEVKKSHVAPLGVMFVNQLLPPLFDERSIKSLETVRAKGATTEALAHLFEVADRRRQRESLEREQRARVDVLKLPVFELPHSFGGPIRRADIEKFAAMIIEGGRL